MLRVLLIAIGTTAVLYCVAVVLFYVSQRNLLYFPSHQYLPPREAYANRAFREFPVRTEDGIPLKGWYAPATRQPFTIVFFHGNGDDLISASRIAAPYIAAGYGFLIAEYRGYSGLRGKPTEAGLYADARTYLHGLTAEGLKTRNIVLFGHSLGTGVAVQMAEEFHVGGIMLLAPFLSIPKVARKHFPFLPVMYLAKDRFENEKKIGNIHVPVLIVTGAKDQVIPPSQAKKLYALAHEPREFHSLASRGHNNLFSDFAPLSMGWIARTCRIDG